MEMDAACQVLLGDRFPSLERFLVVLKARELYLGERWKKGSKLKTVALANKTITDPRRLYKSDFGYTYVNFECVHFGQFTSRGNVRKTKSKKCNCKAFIRLNANRKAGVLVVKALYLEHNHPLGQYDEVPVPPRRPKISVLTEEEKRAKATELFKELTSIMVECDQAEFDRRCQTLQEMGDSWKSGQTVKLSGSSEVKALKSNSSESPRVTVLNSNSSESPRVTVINSTSSKSPKRKALESTYSKSPNVVKVLKSNSSDSLNIKGNIADLTNLELLQAVSSIHGALGEGQVEVIVQSM